jgi:hypothetical protein
MCWIYFIIFLLKSVECKLLCRCGITVGVFLIMDLLLIVVS